MKPLFIIGQAASRNPLIKDSHILEMRQTEKMKEFREGRCNLLVATSVLEEGVDIPACNVIIRFDQVKTYCDYVQTKGTLLSRFRRPTLRVEDSFFLQVVPDPLKRSTAF